MTDTTMLIAAAQGDAAVFKARVAELEAVMDDVARTLHAHNRPSLAGRVRIECRDKLFAALQRERSNG